MGKSGYMNKKKGQQTAADRKLKQAMSNAGGGFSKKIMIRKSAK